jgi:hypothetical protein
MRRVLPAIQTFGGKGKKGGIGDEGRSQDNSVAISHVISIISQVKIIGIGDDNNNEMNCI